MRWSWLPWRFLIRRAARAHGFLDPLALIARLQRFAQPSEVSEPIELLRAGVVFHARGLINTRVIQHNLDWVWPYWIERQFDPASDAFIPRAFSVTHVNLTHRNWTAVGRPDHAGLPIVDPRGLVTPFYDGPSLDAWVLGDDGERLYPSRETHASQYVELNDDGAVVTEVVRNGLRLLTRAVVRRESGRAVLNLHYEARAQSGGDLALALRPYNPEGVSFVHHAVLGDDARGWRVDGDWDVRFDAAADRHYVSDYRHGDVAIHLDDPDAASVADCDTGLATAAALFRIEPGGMRRLSVRVPLKEADTTAAEGDWHEALAGTARLDVPDAGVRFLYDNALRTVMLHTVEDCYPGPYTYKRFWFRDAAFIVHALLHAGLTGRARRMLDHFPERQHRTTGYFHSQDGEWDANGEAMWILARYHEATGETLPESWLHALRRGGRWIARKRTDPDGGTAHAGLLPAGFSAEHFGPNDYYYWDDYWAVAGLEAAAGVLEGHGDGDRARAFRDEAVELRGTLERCHERDAGRLGRPLIPASPYRRMDAGAVGALVAGYPLRLLPADDARLLGTADWLMDNARVHGGFFQDMIHSGINAYLTLHLAQVLMRAGDPRCHELMRAVAGLATPTGQWPEAIHPRTLGGCMGDGQHVWAAAEWLVYLRDAFVREEGERLVLASGVPPQWFAAGEPMSFGPTPTRFGPVTVDIRPATGHNGAVEVCWQAEWRRRPEGVDIAPAGVASVRARAEDGAATLQWRAPA
ncbi:hypothetical protein NYO91_08590 [Arhodomonas aquaeolei]|uniref:hypothetical protein n=1 Tax=Arhodomonas TaxID=2368 RepID=UPI0021699692|nr:hypothetical protein [Arhodomonas aquaeolei]MCS4504132.1 hypothetical protein [Arhodomonas aquaeolei]